MLAQILELANLTEDDRASRWESTFWPSAEKRLFWPRWSIPCRPSSNMPATSSPTKVSWSFTSWGESPPKPVVDAGGCAAWAEESLPPNGLTISKLRNAQGVKIKNMNKSLETASPTKEEVWKTCPLIWSLAQDLQVVMATAGLFLELAKGSHCDISKLSGHPSTASVGPQHGDRFRVALPKNRKHVLLSLFSFQVSHCFFFSR